MAFLDFIKNRNDAAPQQPAAQSQPKSEAPAQRSVESLPSNVKSQAVEAARPAAELMDKATASRTAPAQPSQQDTPSPARGRSLSMER